MMIFYLKSHLQLRMMINNLKEVRIQITNKSLSRVIILILSKKSLKKTKLVLWYLSLFSATKQYNSRIQPRKTHLIRSMSFTHARTSSEHKLLKILQAPSKLVYFLNFKSKKLIKRAAKGVAAAHHL